MTRRELAERLNEDVRLTWKQLAWFGALVVLPWVLTISVAVAVANSVNEAQQKSLDGHAHTAEALRVVENDIGWLKQSQRRVELALFGNSVIPIDESRRERAAADQHGQGDD